MLLREPLPDRDKEKFPGLPDKEPKEGTEHMESVEVKIGGPESAQAEGGDDEGKGKTEANGASTKAKGWDTTAKATDAKVTAEKGEQRDQKTGKEKDARI